MGIVVLFPHRRTVRIQLFYFQCVWMTGGGKPTWTCFRLLRSSDKESKIQRCWIYYLRIWETNKKLFILHLIVWYKWNVSTFALKKNIQTRNKNYWYLFYVYQLTNRMWAAVDFLVSRSTIRLLCMVGVQQGWQSSHVSHVFEMPEKPRDLQCPLFFNDDI